MEGQSRRFWFDVMDGDGDGFLNMLDITELDSEWEPENQTISEKSSVWIELCDMCGIGLNQVIKYQYVCNPLVSTFCFRHLILQGDDYEIIDTVISFVFYIYLKFFHSRGYSFPVVLLLSVAQLFLEPTSNLPTYFSHGVNLVFILVM